MLHGTDQQIAAGNEGKIGLIDVGSNSVRLVVYDRLKRAPYPIYNEKVMCQLGRGLSSTGTLNPDGVAMAHRAINRFVALADNMEVTELDVIATAAVREAKDGGAFAESLEEQHSLRVEVISGEQEAKLGAHGVQASVHQPHGLIADLGGGSLELARLDSKSRIAEHVSLPIGVLRLIDECETAEDIRQKVNASLKKIKWLAECKGEVFYAIGGSFRNLARTHMYQSNYPLMLVHGYKLPAKEAKNLLDHITESDADTIADMPGVSTKRAEAMPAAAIIMDELMRYTSPKHITFSGGGIREGYLYAKLSPFLRGEDALIAACVEISRNTQRSLAYAKELYEWMQSVLKKQSEGSKRLAYACCLLQDIARYINPGDQASWAYERIIQSNLNGLNHKQRTQLALTMYHCYSFSLKHEFLELELLNDKSMHWARLIGTIASLAHHLTGSVAGTLHDIGLNISKNKTSLSLPESMQNLHGEVIDRHLADISESYQSWRTFK